MDNWSAEGSKWNLGFDLVELQKINLAPGDVLSVKLIGPDFDVDTMQSLKDHLSMVFPSNRVMVFTLPTGSDLKFEAITNTPYCSDCSCGKKERAENDSNSST